MKTKLFLFSLLSIFVYGACEDTIDSIGIGLQPIEDSISAYETIINIDAYTVKVDSIFTNSINGLLGNFYDPYYGNIKGGYICQYYPSLGFGDSVVNHKIDSVRLNIYYSSYFGDSLAPMEVSVYPVVKKQLENNYYTNINPDDYCNRNKVWGSKSYTAWDLTLPDSIRNNSTYYKNVSIPLPTDWGQTLYEEYLQQGKTLGSVEEFTKRFPGTYIESSFGSRNLLKVDITEISIYYQECYKKDGKDTIATNAAVLTVTEEVIQLNHFENEYNAKLLEDYDDKMYLKTPSGVISKIIIPVPEIIKNFGKKKFNSVKLNIAAYPQPQSDYPLPLPGVGISGSAKAKLLLIEPDSVKSFFENQKVADFNTSYSVAYSSTTGSYSFDNIANLIQNAMAKAPDKNLELFLIPVMVEYYTYNYTDQEYATSHYLAPSAVTLKKGGDNLQIKIIASELEIK
ncbi:MAG: DUF4270 domain-containing protein [Dysgonamonadaceae bacterium]|jgi:hypothetical protein|nr:DUF4270 domain-containing protein [Dysgonamonadaceae bacterium]